MIEAGFIERARDDSRLGVTDFGVLIEMVKRAGTAGAHVPRKDVAAAIGLTPQRVSQCTRDLVACGYLAVEKQFARNGGQLCNRYRVIMSEGAPS